MTTYAALRELAERITAPWVTHPRRLASLETRMSAQTDAWAELDAQLTALESAVAADDQADAAQVRARASRVRDLVAALNPENPAPAPGEDGAVVPDPSAPEPTPDRGDVEGDNPAQPTA